MGVTPCVVIGCARSNDDDIETPPVIPSSEAVLSGRFPFNRARVHVDPRRPDRRASRVADPRNSSSMPTVVPSSGTNSGTRADRSPCPQHLFGHAAARHHVVRRLAAPRLCKLTPPQNRRHRRSGVAVPLSPSAVAAEQLRLAHGLVSSRVRRCLRGR